jgi:Mg2+/citrate symporter
VRNPTNEVISILIAIVLGFSEEQRLCNLKYRKSMEKTQREQRKKKENVEYLVSTDSNSRLGNAISSR